MILPAPVPGPRLPGGDPTALGRFALDRGAPDLGDLDPAVADALDAVDPADLIALTRELLQVPSTSGSPEESEVQHRLARRLDAAGMDTDLWQIDLPGTMSHPDFPGSEAEREQAWGLVGTWGGTGGPTLVLNGHVDVVPPGDPALWTTPAYSGEVRDGRVLGRGACDMKAGVACQVVAVEALRRAGVQLRGRVQLQSVVGEEDGGLGTFATLRRGYRGDLAVICEPTSAGLVTASAGALTFRLVVAGRSAHGSMRLSGVDAVDKYLLVHAALRELETERNRDVDPLMANYRLPYPLSVGRLRAGDWPSSVPDLLVAEGRLGVALGEPVEHARAALEDAVARVCAGDVFLSANPVQVQWWGGQFASGRLEGGTSLVPLLSGAHAALHGSHPSVQGVPYGSDQRLLSGLGGVPTVLYGPGDVRHAHSPDESVPVADMVQVTRTLVLLAAQVCGTRQVSRASPSVG